MPTLDWLRKEFDYGYDSGDVLAPEPDAVRAAEELRCGASYREITLRAMAPFLRPDSRAMELGPGRGSWTRALLRFLPQGEVHALDFQDARPWLRPEEHPGRLFCHQVADNSFAETPEGYFDFFWSFGTLCHCNAALIATILANSLARMKHGGVAVLQHGDWGKLDAMGWEQGCVPTEFRDLPDDAMWWPRNDGAAMAAMARDAGWEVLEQDMGLIRRDGLIRLRRP